jgi:hypothetical protein
MKAENNSQQTSSDEGHHANCTHPFRSKCSATKIESVAAREEFKVSCEQVLNNKYRSCGITTMQLQRDTQRE